MTTDDEVVVAIEPRRETKPAGRAHGGVHANERGAAGTTKARFGGLLVVVLCEHFNSVASPPLPRKPGAARRSEDLCRLRISLADARTSRRTLLGDCESEPSVGALLRDLSGCEADGGEAGA